MDPMGQKMKEIKKLDKELETLIRANYKPLEADRILSGVRANSDRKYIDHRITYYQKCIEGYKPEETKEMELK